MELDPAVRAAFSLRSNPRSYALLIGSGISRAVVPTGWDVYVDLVTQLATRSGAGDEDPQAWYRRNRGGRVGYDTVLEDLDQTPAERVGFLRPYFERPDEDGDLPQPTPAHRAIAQLMKRGLIHIVLTTNMDRLLEQALSEIGIAPTVIATPAAIEGMLPLGQQEACIIKLHGDYQDPGFLNTGEELAEYPRAVNALLGRLFDEYGTIVAGWSSIYDPALRTALERCTTRRFRTFWVEPFPLSVPAASLVEHRDARLVEEDANAFFTRRFDSIEALERVDAPHPSTIPLLVATAKRRLERGEQIRLHDLIARELQRAREAVGDWQYQASDVRERTVALVHRIDSAMAPAAALLAVCAR